MESPITEHDHSKPLVIGEPNPCAACRELGEAIRDGRIQTIDTSEEF